MRQVPKYLLIGSGRISKHLEFYLKNTGHNLITWSRKNNTQKDLLDKIKLSSHILILISDEAITNFINKYKPQLKNKICIHCSGSLYTNLAFGAHPLNTFSNNLYDLDTYKKTPFILDKNSPDFSDLFPLLKNPNFKLDHTKKPLYHAACVMANNFTTILWEHAFEIFSDKLQIPKQALVPILEQTCLNLSNNNKKNNNKSILTGPLARKDTNTINKNIKALEQAQDDFELIYKAFKKLKIYLNN